MKQLKQSDINSSWTECQECNKTNDIVITKISQHLLHARPVLSTAKCFPCVMYSSQPPYEASSVLSSILWMRKLRMREMKQLASVLIMITWPSQHNPKQSSYKSILWIMKLYFLMLSNTVIFTWLILKSRCHTFPRSLTHWSILKSSGFYTFHMASLNHTQSILSKITLSFLCFFSYHGMVPLSNDLSPLLDNRIYIIIWIF